MLMKYQYSASPYSLNSITPSFRQKNTLTFTFFGGTARKRGDGGCTRGGGKRRDNRVW